MSPDPGAVLNVADNEAVLNAPKLSLAGASPLATNHPNHSDQPSGKLRSSCKRSGLPNVLEKPLSGNALIECLQHAFATSL